MEFLKSRRNSMTRVFAKVEFSWAWNRGTMKTPTILRTTGGKIVASQFTGKCRQEGEEKMQRNFAFALVLISATFLVGCGGANSNAGANSNNANAGNPPRQGAVETNAN